MLQKFLRDCVTGFVWNWILNICVLFDAWDVYLAEVSHKVIFSSTFTKSKHTWRFYCVIQQNDLPMCESYLWRKQLLYSCAHCADCELCVIGHDVSWLDVAVIHGVFKCSSSISVLMAHITIEGDFGSSSEMNQYNKILCHYIRGIIYSVHSRDRGHNIDFGDSA